MKYLYPCFFIAVCLLTTSPAFAQKKIEFFPGLEQRKGFFYKIGDEEPFTGSTESEYSNGNTFVAANFKNGKLHGSYTAYYANGQKMGISNYKMGVKHGEAISWHENGQLASKITFKQGKEHGRLEVYYPNGQKRMEAFYKEGKLEGALTVWKPDGRLYSIKSYVEGELVWEEFYGKDGEAGTDDSGPETESKVVSK